jgi:hypothetical protein
VVFLFILAAAYLPIAWSQDKPAAAPVNLIPDKPGKTPSYWCTWGAQNYASTDAAFQYCVELKGHFAIADTLTEKAVFHDPGWAKYFQKARSDLYLMFDLGWDTPAGVDFDNKRWLLGTLELATEKFPSCTGTPAERLRKLNEITKAAGWRGAGIWLASQAPGDGNDGKFMEQKELEKFWRTRAEWTRDADIEYWKVDYGARGGQPEFRKMLTKIAAEVAPGLLVEHGRGSGPLNDEECPWDLKEYNRIGSYRTWGNGQALKQAVTIAQFTDILRTYDVTAYLSVPTTLDRVAQILAEFSGKSDVSCIINCEDEPYIAAGLGCATGILRHPLWRDELPNFQYDPFKFRKKIDAVTRAVRWHRIAPAFPIGKTENLLDKNVLIDTWSFRHGDSWATWMDGRETLQTAPARVARGMPLPDVDSGRGPAPYVICSHNPSGAISVATLPRISTGKGPYLPLVDVSIEVGDGKSPIGIFGKYRSLTLKLTEDPGDCKIMAQDLAGDRAIDITAKVKREGKTITLSGELIDEVGLSAASPGDLSEPGLVLAIKR